MTYFRNPKAQFITENHSEMLHFGIRLVQNWQIRTTIRNMKLLKEKLRKTAIFRFWIRNRYLVVWFVYQNCLRNEYSNVIIFVSFSEIMNYLFRSTKKNYELRYLLYRNVENYVTLLYVGFRNISFTCTLRQYRNYFVFRITKCHPCTQVINHHTPL